MLWSLIARTKTTIGSPPNYLPIFQKYHHHTSFIQVVADLQPVCPFLFWIKILCYNQIPGACCRPPNTNTFRGWGPNPRTVLGLNFVLGSRTKYGGCLTICNEGANFVLTHLFVIFVWPITCAYSSNKPMTISVKQTWSVDPKFLQSSGVAKEKIPHLLLW